MLGEKKRVVAHHIIALPLMTSWEWVLVWTFEHTSLVLVMGIFFKYLRALGYLDLGLYPILSYQLGPKYRVKD
jgi:hypothetical protein